MFPRWQTPASAVYFVDNTFNLPSAYAIALCRAIGRSAAEHRLAFILYPQQVPEDLVEAMAKPVALNVSLGFESGSPGVLRMMNKRFQPEEVREISGRLATHGIRRMGFLLFGRPRRNARVSGRELGFC